MLTHEREGWIRTRDAHVLAGQQGAWQPWPQEGALLGLLTHSCQGRIVGYVKERLSIRDKLEVGLALLLDAAFVAFLVGVLFTLSYYR